MSSVERERVESFGHPEDGLLTATPWYDWGPYLSERAWGTVREDYSPDGEAWNYFPHDHARSRTYRWSEDGMAGICDSEQRLCLALALWNGRDPFLKERMFGLTGPQGNHGEDVKEYWWFTDATPSHSWLRWRYHYPQAEFPYEDLVAENGRRDRNQPEYELLDTGAFAEDRYWVVEVTHAKADPHDLLMEISLTNAGPETATIHVLPHLWFRNLWSFDTEVAKPELRQAAANRIELEHPRLGPLSWEVETASDGADPRLLFCDNETNQARLYGATDSPPYPKDGINDHVVSGAASVNPELVGTKAAAWYQLTLGPGETGRIRARLRPPSKEPAFGAGFDEVLQRSEQEADDFYGEVIPATASADEALVARQAFAGMIWGKQFYNYDVRRWLEGDPTQIQPPPQRKSGRNSSWTHLNSRDIISMPDVWEYPWFASWDLAFHTVSLAHLDPAFAKYQLLALCREWFQHPNGALPAYEWSFSDVNPPVHAWAALQVWQIDGGRDRAFLARLLPKLLMNFTWWVNRIDPQGDHVFGGGFLGMDNISVLDRSNLPAGFDLKQADGTAWMAGYALALVEIGTILAEENPAWADIPVEFVEHFGLISKAMQDDCLWDEVDGFYYDVLEAPDGSTKPIQVRSMVGVLPLLTTVVLDEDTLARSQAMNKRQGALIRRHRHLRVEDLTERWVTKPDGQRLVLGVVAPNIARRVLRRVFDEGEFLSDYGLRSISRAHQDNPFQLELQGATLSVDYEPAESRSALFGGNSNWRGPIWMPVNYLVVRGLQRNSESLGESGIEYPTGSGKELSFGECAEDLRRRLISLFLRGEDGRRPCHGNVAKLQDDPNWRDCITFNEYFNGDDGAGLGATHQTGWTGLVADLICRPNPFSSEGAES